MIHAVRHGNAPGFLGSVSANSKWLSEKRMSRTGLGEMALFVAFPLEIRYLFLEGGVKSDAIPFRPGRSGLFRFGVREGRAQYGALDAGGT
jgi:hypothetical protein